MTPISKKLFNEINQSKPNENCKNLDCKFYVDSYEKKIFDLQQILEISRSLCSTLEFDKLIQSILDNCTAQFHVLSAGVFLLESFDSKSFNLGSNFTGFDIKNPARYKISSNSPLAAILEKNNIVYNLHELKAELIASGKNRRKEDIEKIKTDFATLASLHPTLIVPLLQRGHLEGILVFGERLVFGDDTGDSGEYYSDYDKEHVLVIASLAAVAINNAALVERSSTDMMTHLKLKYYFFNVLTEKLDIARKEGSHISILMFDIDFFKKFNDNYGHACGDFVLQTVASIIRESIRNEDMASRYGGEEFTVMLNGAAKDNAMIVAERIRRKIETYDFCYEDQHMHVTISVGVSEYDSQVNPVNSPNLLVDQADKALYVSKRSGRNRVTFASADTISDVKLPD